MQDILKAQIVELRAELVRYANRVVIGSSIDGEDLVQDVIVKVLKSDKDFTAEDNIRAYLYQAIRNHYINVNIRAQRTTSLASLTHDQFGEANAISNNEAISNLLASKSAEDVALFENLSPEMVNALTLLDDGIRETFILITLKGLTYDECAEAQGIARGTVMSRCHRAKVQLRKTLVAA